jgi:hypothetical protein
MTFVYALENNKISSEIEIYKRKVFHIKNSQINPNINPILLYKIILISLLFYGFQP